MSIDQLAAKSNIQKGQHSVARKSGVKILKSNSPQSKDSVRFGSDSQRPDHPTHTEDPQSSKPRLTHALWEGAKYAFSPKQLGWDIVFGTIATVVTAIIPPHIHALGMLPTWVAIGASIRGVQGFWAAYSQK